MPSVYKPGQVKCLHVEMSPDERHRMKIASAIRGITLRSFARLAIIEATDRQLDEVQSGQADVFQPQKQAEPLRA